MRFTIGQDQYRMRFAHVAINGQGKFVPTDDFSAANRATICEIQKLNPQNNEFEGIAGSYTVCSEKDIFSRASGRKAALTFAMKQINDKALRTQIWNNYLNPTEAEKSTPKNPNLITRILDGVAKFTGLF